MILNIGGGGGVKPRIVVTAPTGSDVTVSKGSTILYAPEVSGTWTFNVPEQGDWSATAILGSKTASKTVSVSKVGVYNVTLRYVSATLNDNSWEDIKSVADASEGQNYWAVGDTKQITINGKLSDGLTLSNYNTWVYIIGFDHNSDVEGTGIAFGGFKTAQTGGKDVALCDSGYNSNKTSGKWFNMNNSETNSGGWKSSRMRSITLPLVKSAMPTDLQTVLKTTTIYSDNTGGGHDTASFVTSTLDDIYLLAEYEIFGARSVANSAEQNYQQQYAYYAAGNSKVKYRHDSTATTVYWWARSVRATNAYIFCSVNTRGTADSNTATYSFGVSPCFKVGTTPIFPTLNDNSWSAIAKVAYTSEGANYWSVGDTKEITINGKLSDGLTLSNYKTWVYILGFDHNEAVEGKGIVFGGFKTAASGGIDVALCDNGYNSVNISGQWFNMNNSETNSGGWASCRMRSTTLPLVKSALPSELTSVIKTTSIYSDNTGGGSDVASYVTATQDELYLLAEFEIFGARTHANSAECNHQQQYAYYVAGNSKVKYRHDSTATAVLWWERSVDATRANNFCSVNTSGAAARGAAHASFGLAVAFRVCYTPPQPISNLAVGNIVKVKESGTDVDYIIVQQGNPDATMYDASCDGTWLLRKDCLDNRQWDSNEMNKWQTSSIRTWLNNTFLNKLQIKDMIAQSIIPYSQGDLSDVTYYLANGSSNKVFFLSGYEFGFTSSYNSGLMLDGAKLDYFNDNTSRATSGGFWTRSIEKSMGNKIFVIDNTGVLATMRSSNGNPLRPAFIIPSDTLIDSSGNIVLE